MTQAAASRGRAAPDAEEVIPGRAPGRRIASPQFWRLASGLVLLAFATTHFLNHAVGVFGVEAMEAVQVWRHRFWHSAPGTLALYGAFAVHIGLNLWKTAGRTTWRMPPLEALQLASGLLVPVLLIDHVVATRAMEALHATEPLYGAVLRAIWSGAALKQGVLLLIVWAHGMIGLHYNLRLKPWFPRWRDAFLGLALLVPALALAGFMAGAREATLAGGPAMLSPGEREAAVELIEAGWWGLRILALAGLAAFGVRALGRGQGGRIAVRYVGAGARSVRVAPGPTLLEISRMHRVPHASVCGGRARCSTCRVRVLEGAGALDRPGEREAGVLARIKAPPGIRLACRAVPRGDLAVELLVPPGSALASLAGGAQGGGGWGIERPVTVVFGDLRGFTSLAERHLAFDLVFLINRYVALMTEVVEAEGGFVDKVLGDGVLALFGAQERDAGGAPDSGAGAGLRAAARMLGALNVLNEEFEAQVGARLGMGIGVHTGPAILGRVGSAGSALGLTALGDTVNAASRLQEATKALHVPLVVSEDALRAAGLAAGEDTRRTIELRGREERLVVHAVSEAEAAALARVGAQAGRQAGAHADASAG